MPRVKIDYVVSFSSEDPGNPASNLLLTEVSKKRWLCPPGEPSCSVVLQLARAVKISSLQIGIHHAALVEVLVGRSETPTEQFEVLVPCSTFLSPGEARGPPLERVRSFPTPTLAAAAAQRWDRLRLVCSQPYNKHCTYGLTFIHVFEADAPPAPPLAPAAPAPPPPLPLDTFSSSDEEFSPGELFAKHRQSGDTGAQIRQATSLALNNNSEAAAKLVKTSLGRHKPTPPTPSPRDPPRGGDRPHDKIDYIVERQKDEKSKHDAKTPKPKEKLKENKVDETPRSREEPTTGSNSGTKEKRERSKEFHRKKERDDSTKLDAGASSGAAERNGVTNSRKDESRKRPRSDRKQVLSQQENESSPRPGPACDRPLSGVVFVLSGYVNPRRAALRARAAALGAAARAHWGAGCTHLICAFSNTPKLSAVRAMPGGADVPAPRGEWLDACGRTRRLLPWQWFAAEPARRLPQPDLGLLGDEPAVDDAESDTDDEIERVLRQQKKTRTSPPPRTQPSSPSPRAHGSSPRTREEKQEDSDEVEFVKDERIQGNVTLVESDSCDTDAEEPAAGGAGAGAGGGGGTLPALFLGRRFVLCAAPPARPPLERYCRAYGGLVVEQSEAEETDEEHYILCGPGAEPAAGAVRGPRLRLAWLWACHEARRLCPIRDYLIT